MNSYSVAHHLFGPSSLGRRYHCPGSAREEEGLSDVSTEDSLDGLECHEKIAGVLSGRLALETLEDGDHKALVSKAYDKSAELSGPGTEVAFELAMQLFDGEDAISSGTADEVIYHEETIHVIDWKLGRKPLDEAAVTHQISCYLAMALQDYPEATMAHGHIFQLRIGEEYHATLSRSEIPKVVSQVKALIERSRQPEAKLNVGPWCQYCRAVGLCPATQAMARSVSRLPEARAAATAPTLKAAEELVRKQMERLPADKVNALADIIHIVRIVVEAWRSRATECLSQDPNSIKDYELKTTNGARTADTMELWAALRGSLSQKEYLEACKISVAAVEDMVVRQWRQREPGLSTAAAKNRFAALTNGIVRQPEIRKLERRRKKE